MVEKIEGLTKNPRISWAATIGAAAFSAAALVLAFPNASIRPLVWVGLVPLLVLALAFPLRAAVAGSVLAGFALFFFGLHWIRFFTVPGWILLAAYHALFVVLFVLGVRVAWLRWRVLLPMVAGALWVSLEFLRSFLLTGFPWLYLAHAEYRSRALIQVAEFTGAYGLSFFIIAVNALAAEIALAAFFGRGWRWRWARFAPDIVLTAIAAGLIALCAGRAEKVRTSPGPRIAVLQGNIPQELKLMGDPQSQRKMLEAYVELSLDAAQQRPDLIVWPETMVPGILNLDTALQDYLKALVQQLDVPILLGAVTFEGDDAGQWAQFNSAYLLEPHPAGPRFTGRYDKIQLVPFGEYVPLRSRLPFLTWFVPYDYDFSPGRSLTLLSPARLCSFRVLICFEDAFPDLVRQMSAAPRRPDFLINISNDGWFRDSGELEQHLAASVFRAVENRISVVRATNTGISAFIAPNGDIKVLRDERGRTRQVRGLLVRQVLLSEQPATFYGRHGDLFAWGCLLASVVMVALAALATQERAARFT